MNSNLMDMAKRPKRYQLIFCLACFICIQATYFIGVYLPEIYSMRTERSSLSPEQESKEIEIERAGLLISLEAKKQRLEKLHSKLPKDKGELSLLMDQLGELLEKSELTLHSLRRGIRENSSSQGEFERLLFIVECHGRYHHLEQFIFSLSNLSSLLVAEKVDLERDQHSPPQIHIRLYLATYLRKEKEL